MRATSILLILLIAACSSAKSGPALTEDNQKRLTEVLANIDKLPAEERGVIAAKELAEIEAARLPGSVIEMLNGFHGANPDMRGAILSTGLNKSMDTLKLMCGENLEQKMSTTLFLAREERVSALRTACKTDRFNLVTNPSANNDFFGFFLGHLVLSHLEHHGSASANERMLIKYVATSTMSI